MKKGLPLLVLAMLAAGYAMWTYRGHVPEGPRLSLSALTQWGAAPSQGADLGIDDNPLRRNYYIVFDGSGSMSNTECTRPQEKITVAKSAVKEFVSRIPENDNVGLYAFSEDGSKEYVPLSYGDRSRIYDAIGAISAGGSTPLGRSLGAAIGTLADQAQRQRGYGEYNLVIVTDGKASDRERVANAVNLIVGETPVIVHTIGFCIGSDHDLNRPGQTIYRSAMNTEELRAGLATVLAEAEDFQDSSFNE